MKARFPLAIAAVCAVLALPAFAGLHEDMVALDRAYIPALALTNQPKPDASKRAKRILAEIRAGTVYWNCCDRVSPRLPWSGVGHSGIGLTLSTYGIQTFTRPKAWHLRSA